VSSIQRGQRLTDRHTSLFEQDALAELLANGAYERHVRSIRRRNTERRMVLLQALADHLGHSVTIVGADTGLHVVACSTASLPIVSPRSPQPHAQPGSAYIPFHRCMT
jgi:GntR family transcriptional regulator/MocR family aminotransferase